MLITLTEANISLNLGVLDIMRTIGELDDPHSRELSYDKKHSKMVKVYREGSTLFIEAEKSDIHFKLDIDSLQYSNIKVKIGSIESTALATVKESYAIKVGAIQLTIKKEEVGDLYMRVKAGIIVATPSLIKVTPYNESGFEAHYKGLLKGQKTELLVDAGAILCNIL
jgi:hypothetical protein